MPKLKPSTNERLNRLFVGTMNKYIEVEGITDKQFCKKIGITERTLYNWKKNPENIKLCNIRTICKSLHIPDKEIIDFIFERN